jgi:DNA-directed RNA polymerase subunit M/transcription elongation factor TFIIS
MSGSTQFCKSCFNLMMPREERGERKLVYFCKSCNLSQDAHTPVVYRNEVVKSATCVAAQPPCPTLSICYASLL